MRWDGILDGWTNPLEVNKLYFEEIVPRVIFSLSLLFDFLSIHSPIHQAEKKEAAVAKPAICTWIL